MSNGNSPWHVSMPGRKPAGPFTEEQVLGALRSGRLKAGGLCWCEGMSEWLPLSQVEPFAAALRSQAGHSVPPPAISTAAPAPSPSGTSRGLFRRLAVGAVVLALLGGAGYAGYVVLDEKWTVERGERLLAEGEYREASFALEDVAEGGYVYRRNANYLLAVAATRRFATGKEEQDEQRLRRPKRRFEEAFADEARRHQAKTDLADLLAVVPPTAPDALPRCLLLADFLAELGLAEDKALAAGLLEKVKQLAEHSADTRARPLETRVVRRIVEHDPALAEELVALALAQAGTKPFLWSHGPIQQWVREDESLAAPLASALLAYAEGALTSDRPHEFEPYLSLAEQIDPEVGREIARKRLAAVKKQLESGDFAAALASLDRQRSRLDGVEADTAPLYFAIAEGLADRDPAGASRALQRASNADAALADTEVAGWLWIRLNARPSEERLRRCREFLQRYPESPRRPDVYAVVLTDAVQLSQQFGRRPEQAAKQLSAAQEAARALLAAHADRAELDRQVLALAERLAAVGDPEQAETLTGELLQARPETPVRSELEQAMARWKAAVREKKGLPSNLPPDLEEAANLIAQEFQMITLSQPGAIRQIVRNPQSVHVVQVAPDCTAPKFAAEEADMLRQWVAGGGILWVTNDVLSFFDIKYERTWGSSRSVCTPAVTPQMCPIVDRCRNVQLQVPRRSAANLSHPQVVPLLSSGGKALWSLVPYGKGWVSDVKPVDQASYDGPRFWVNFRLFCMGRIAVPTGGPGALIADPRVPVVAPTEPTVLSTPGELDDALADLAAHRVIWMQLAGEHVEEAQRSQLDDWVEAGGVLWLDTDLGRDFGFRLVRAPDGQMRGRASVSETNHPILEGVAPGTAVEFTLSPNSVAISDETRELTRTMTPLVGWSAGRHRLWLVLAVRQHGRGVVVFRPRELDAGTAGKSLEQNLRTWSFQVAPPRKPAPQADERNGNAASGAPLPMRKRPFMLRNSSQETAITASQVDTGESAVALRRQAKTRPPSRLSTVAPPG